MAVDLMCDRSCSSVHVFNAPAPTKSNNSLLMALEHVDLNSFSNFGQVTQLSHGLISLP